MILVDLDRRRTRVVSLMSMLLFECVRTRDAPETAISKLKDTRECLVFKLMPGRQSRCLLSRVSR
jgi:hypothetical protein